MKYLWSFSFLSFFFCSPALGDLPLLKEERAIPLPFASEPDRDRSYVDLSVADPTIFRHADSFRIEFDCDVPDAVGSMTFYVRSGKGWYSRAVVADDVTEFSGRFRISVSGFPQSEGSPGPIDQGDLIRFSIWRGAGKNATATLKRIDAVFSSTVAVLPIKGEIEAARGMVSRLKGAGIPVGSLTVDELSDEKLEQCKIVVFPCTAGLEPDRIAMLERFVERGGKLIAFYQLPAELMKALGFKPGRYLKSPDGDAALAEVRFVKGTAGSDTFASTEDFKQKSWNIVAAQPDEQSSHHAKIAAWWYDAAGRKTEYPALLESDRGAFFSHILTPEDGDRKRFFLIDLFGHFDPSLRRRPILNAWQALFRIGDVRQLTPQRRDRLETEYRDELKRRGFELTPDCFSDLPSEKDAATIALRFRELLSALQEIRQDRIRQFCESVPTKTPEFRAWWEHAGLGAYHGDWDRTMKELSEAGFNAVISNLLWGGSCHYASDVIQRSKKFEQYGDQVEQAIRAGKKYGVEVHAWQVCYRLTGSTPEYIESMKQAGRTQKRADGTVGDWLCPSHPDNVDLECATFCELVRKYPDLTGIHYDYIRYPDGEHCYCEGCRDRFSKETGSEIAKWPADVRHGGPYREQFEQWRCDTITRLVRRVHREAKAIRPSIKISAAVFADYPGCRRSIGQDWPVWVEKGYLDFICPMNYTENVGRFSALIERQKKLVDGRIPLYPGIGATATGIAMTPDRVALEIQIAREEEMSGFVIFNLSERTIQTIAPMLQLGPTRKGQRAP